MPLFPNCDTRQEDQSRSLQRHSTRAIFPAHRDAKIVETGRLPSERLGVFDCRKCGDATSAGGCSPRSAPRSWMGRLAPHRFAGRQRLLSLGTHQSPAGRHGKRERAARNGMGGVSNGDDFLSPWSELPPWTDDLWRTTTGIVQVDAQARAQPGTAQHVWVVLGREEPLACSWGGGLGGLGSRVASFIYRRGPPDDRPGTSSSPCNLGLNHQSFGTDQRLDPSRATVIPAAHHVVQCP
ncbi:hypothetical protein B0T18DRAFT_79077 [Schizothecium vesticola]|uniref:Uncharacterized protein n=1 Tax=Schizothecium vesticola TaxID=314040 RepID=A0AA40F666_9PEZI|nr:hypothetical protein B0T18DRAFT_79077 [Schizothecium vesticola]